MIFRDCLKLGTLSLLLITGASGQTASVPRFTVSQVGLHFICTADGQPDMYSWRIPQKDTRDGAYTSDYVIPDIPPEEYEEKSQGPWPLISGGRTALRLREENLGDSYIAHFYPTGFNGSGARLSNVDEVHWRNDQTHPDDFKPAEGMIKERFYSNYPPLSNPVMAGRYGTSHISSTIGSLNYGFYFRRHPGYDWRNWNWTLAYDTPLEVNQKRLQAMLYLHLHTPPTTDTNLDFDLAFVISKDDMNSVMVNGRAIFFSHTEDLVIKTRKSLFENKGTSVLGGACQLLEMAAWS